MLDLAKFKINFLWLADLFSEGLTEEFCCFANNGRLLINLANKLTTYNIGESGYKDETLKCVALSAACVTEPIIPLLQAFNTIAVDLSQTCFAVGSLEFEPTFIANFNLIASRIGDPIRKINCQQFTREKHLVAAAERIKDVTPSAEGYDEAQLTAAFQASSPPGTSNSIMKLLRAVNQVALQLTQAQLEYQTELKRMEAEL